MTPDERKKLAAYIRAHPQHSYLRIAFDTGVSLSTINRIASEAGIVRPRGVKVTPHIPRS
jgi:DNA-binding MurR/RpiR family transcriptional regulator